MSDEHYVKTGRMMFIMAWLIFFIVIFLFFYFYTHEKKSDVQIHQGQLIIAANQQGHYIISGSINNYPVTFMLDTGATFVGIPQNLAKQINLQGKYPVTLRTANGQVTGLLTRVDELSFGQFHFKNIKAVIMPGDHDELVLMGMNVLEQFNINQKNKKLIISH